MIRKYSGKNYLREPKVEPDLSDYVVEIENRSATAVRAWPVGTFPPGDADVHVVANSYYTIAQAPSTQSAIDRALRIHRVEHALRESEIVGIEDLYKLDPREAFKGDE